MQISNGHPDTPTQVWTIRGYMPRDQLVASQRRETRATSITDILEYRVLGTSEVVRRDAAVRMLVGMKLLAGIHI